VWLSKNRSAVRIDNRKTAAHRAAAVLFLEGVAWREFPRESENPVKLVVVEALRML